MIDDSLENAELLAELIESYGPRVRIAVTGAAGLELLSERLANLVFLDLSLPDTTGAEVARTIRARWGTACRIVAWTGYSDPERREGASQAGCNGFMQKPLRLEQLEQWLAGAESVS